MGKPFGLGQVSLSIAGQRLRANDPAANRWCSRDVAAIAQAQGLELTAAVAPYFVDAEAAPTRDTFPVGGLTVVRFTNNHLVYAVTWFALAAMSMFAFAVFWRVPRSSPVVVEPLSHDNRRMANHLP